MERCGGNTTLAFWRDIHTYIPKSHWKAREVGELHLLGAVHHFMHRNSSCCSPAFVLCSFRVRLTELWEVHFETGCTLRFPPYFRTVLPINIQLRTCSWRKLNPHSMWMYLRQNRWHFFLSACLVHEGRCNHVFSCRTDRLDGNYHPKIMSRALTAMRLKANQIQVITMSPECTFGISFWFFWAILIHRHSIWKLSSAKMLLKSQYIF